MKKNKKERLEKKDWAVGDTDDFLMKNYKGVPLNDDTLEEVMASDFPRVYIHDIKDNPDDTCSMEISTNKAFDELFKKEKNRKRVSNKGIQEFFIELLEKGIAKEDGYDIKKLKDV